MMLIATRTKGNATFNLYQTGADSFKVFAEAEGVKLLVIGMNSSNIDHAMTALNTAQDTDLWQQKVNNELKKKEAARQTNLL